MLEYDKVDKCAMLKSRAGGWRFLGLRGVGQQRDNGTTGPTRCDYLRVCYLLLRLSIVGLKEDMRLVWIRLLPPDSSKMDNSGLLNR